MNLFKGYEGCKSFENEGELRSFRICRDTDFFSIEQIGDKGIRRNSNLVRGTNTTDLIRLGNPDLKWEYSNELNIGIEGRFPE